MSDTPRTDARKRWISGHAVIEKWPSFAGEQEVVDAGFAETLERELATVQKDAERYRWLAPRLLCIDPLYDRLTGGAVLRSLRFDARKIRLAKTSVDAALAAAEKGEKG